jgi:cytoskeletal protein RodZ
LKMKKKHIIILLISFGVIGLIFLLWWYIIRETWKTYRLSTWFENQINFSLDSNESEWIPTYYCIQSHQIA